MIRPLMPGATIGVLGSGQLGRMLALAARRWGYRLLVYSPDAETPAGQVADREFCAAYDDLDAIAEFARRCDVVTFEFENVPLAATEAVERHAPVRPGGRVLHTTQHRIREKTFLRGAGLPTARFATIDSEEQLEGALAVTGLPAVLKTAAWGYDGKGQRLVKTLDEARRAWVELHRQPLIAEQFVEFTGEVSVVAARGADGRCVEYGPIANLHRRHILDVSLCPAGLPPATAARAVEMARVIVERLEVVGVLCVEFFVRGDGELLVNELAPRPHNSGHLTIDAHRSSQFEQQMRAICGMPLGSPRQLRPAAMVNLLGDVWQPGPPRWDAAVRDPQVALHLYGKLDARPGRKMGHLTAVASTVDEARRRALAARRRLNAVTPETDRAEPNLQ